MATIPTPPVLDASLHVKPLPERKLSEEEFLAWCAEDTKAEWVDGQVIMMSPANTAHVRLTTFLLRVLSTFVEEHDLGEIFGTELAARITPRSRRVPDVLFVAKERLKNVLPAHVEGPPDLIVEVVSPDSVERDWRDKYDDYQAAGVREYWVVDPGHQRVEAYQLVEGAYQHLIHEQGRIASLVIPGFYLREEWLWQAKLPKHRYVLTELEGAVQSQEVQSPKSE